ncbi:MAG: dihydrolipoyl dehydrogenase [Acidobacteriota bacterium]|nr:dihydrolipoyl dehydrogenase [Acidobacteriota bacterium]
MVVGEVASATDVLVVGAGPGGYAAALRARQLGRRVTLVEKAAVGGICLNEGCIPSKVLIHAAELASMGAMAADFGVTLEASADLKAVRASMERTIGGLGRGVDALLAAAEVERVSGIARFSRPDRIVVDDGERVRHFEFEEVILATGSRPVALRGLERDGERVLDSTDLLRLSSMPASLAVVGGGYIGVELGTAFAKLGARVCMVEACDRLLPLMRPFQGEAVQRRLASLGARVMLGTQARELTQGGLRVETAAGPEEIEAAKILVAVGRVPNTDDLGLELTEVELDDGGLVLVDGSRRACPHILAIGDITDGPALAHKATAEAEVAASTACGVAASFDPQAIPEVVFSDPEIASVGWTPESAERELGAARSFRLPLSASARARTLGSRGGLVEMIVDGDGALVGVHMAGAHVSELAAEAALAIEMGASAEDLALTIHPHPTMSEALAEAAWGVIGRPLHAMRPKV